MEDDERPGGQGDECARDEEKSHSIGATGENTAPYSVFAPRQKTLIIILVAAAGFFSPFTAYVYFPALKTLANDFSVSIELMDLTVTAYLIVQGIAPCILADLSENIGRRPVYLLMFAIYCAASIGLSLQHDYTALLVLRMLQSVGCAPAIALAFGVIGDIAAPHERGVYVGASHIGFNSAPAIGPIIGGLITEKAGWSWIFVLLAAFSGSLLILLAFFLHETSRSIVGNGSIAATGVNQTFLQSLRSGGHNAAKIHKRLRIPSILPCLKLILYKNTSMLLVSYGTFYMMYSCLQATLAQLLEQYYKLSPLQAGLCYLPYGVAGGVASYTVGLLTDRDYRITAEQHNLDIDRRNGDDLQHFPIEKARLRSIFVLIPICSASVVAYGWSLAASAPLCVPLIIQFLIGYTVAGIFNLCSTLMVDWHPKNPVTASAAAGITRCLIAAGGVAVIELLIDAAGPGWGFLVLGGLCFMTMPVLWTIRRKGWEWRKSRTAEEDKGQGSARTP